MTKATMPEPFDSLYDEIDKAMVGCYSAIQMEVYAAAKVREALEEARKQVHAALYPSNPKSDWTDYAYQHADAATQADGVISNLLFRHDNKEKDSNEP